MNNQGSEEIQLKISPNLLMLFFDLISIPSSFKNIFEIPLDQQFNDLLWNCYYDFS